MDQQNKFNFQQARSISETLNSTFTFIRQEFMPLGKAVLFMVGPIVLITSYFSMYYFNGIIQGAMQGSSPQKVLKMIGSPYYWITVALQVLGYIVNMLVVTYYIRFYIQNKRNAPSLNTVWIAAINDLPRIFFYYVVSYLIVILGTLAFVIPGIYLSVGLSLLALVAIHERPGLGKSISRSLKLIKGYWWFTVGVLILAGLVAYLLQMILQMPFILMGVVVGVNMKSAPSAGMVMNLSGFMSLILNLGTLFYAIVFVAMNIHYFSQREKKDASGLQQQIEQLAND